MKGAPKILHSNRELSKKELQTFIDEETKLVKGIFKNFECPGGGAKIVMKKYPGVAAFERWMEDNKEYEVPLYVARYLNGIDVTAKAIQGRLGSCSYPVHDYRVDKDTGRSHVRVGTRRQRFGFQSLEFASV
jgi:hypothetical protein